MSNLVENSNKELFTVLPRENTLPNRIVENIESLLEESRLQPGDKLPTERELAQRFGVSRTVIREAIVALEAKGLLESAPRGGSIVRLPEARTVARSLAFYLRQGTQGVVGQHIHEVRRTLELDIAEHAALRRTKEDLIALKALLDEMAGLADARDRWVQNDVEFHHTLAKATQNPLYPLLLESIADIMLQVRRLAVNVRGSFENALDHHRAIFTYIQRGDAEGARQAMWEHLIDSEEVMNRAQMALMKATEERE
ncbi:MAG TPA: FadR/GntR family transcriptional regulator [Chthonomonas sp.]|uniref:FadR/GntR family transcriptional regulator n=1 Tax=Chthonomonas sp. TaxID=2282153 RepID=UPI002B4B8A6C|nr:FadR/GntR family transcriptional regulator [Chthonomonas sp.]HLI48496.1 FadR/GntR family transcriptional regulator [Chthonomonas sp.]